jgi:large subunit ribosomal protein L10
LGGPVGLIFCFEDPIAVAKTVTSFREAGDRFKVRGGVLEGKPLSREEVVELANMPPREVVLAQLLGVLQAPASHLVRLLNEPGSALARVIDAIGKKAEGAPAS